MPFLKNREGGKYTAKEMAAIWKQHVDSHNTYLQNIDDLIILQGTENTKIEAKDKQETNSNGKKSWFGLWSK